MGTPTDSGSGDEGAEQLSTGGLLAVIAIVAVTLAGGTLLVAPDVGPQLFPSSESDDESDSPFSVTWSDSPLVDDGTGSSSGSDSSNNSAAIGIPNGDVLDDAGERDANEPDTVDGSGDEPNSDAGEAGGQGSSDGAGEINEADEARGERGPPSHAGPPDHAGAPDDAGPPDHAGPSNAGGAEDDGNGD